ncbi:hypothetical protein [Burkholderia sp. BDU5]|nr:hypothetical protein [Burkholderia sp. BDU5]
MTLRHAFADTQEEVVDALTGGAVVDLDERNLTACDRIMGFFA